MDQQRIPGRKHLLDSLTEICSSVRAGEGKGKGTQLLAILLLEHLQKGYTPSQDTAQ